MSDIQQNEKLKLGHPHVRQTIYSKLKQYVLRDKIWWIPPKELHRGAPRTAVMKEKFSLLNPAKQDLEGHMCSLKYTKDQGSK